MDVTCFVATPCSVCVCVCVEGLNYSYILHFLSKQLVKNCDTHMIKRGRAILSQLLPGEGGPSMFWIPECEV